MIQPLIASHMDAVMDIWLHANMDAHPFIEPAFWQSRRQDVRQAIQAADVFVFENGIVEGFIGVVGEGYIAGLFVAKGSRKKGIGRALVEACKARYDELTLAVYEKNTGAVQFYLSEGFCKTAQTINSDTGEAELMMRWKKA